LSNETTPRSLLVLFWSNIAFAKCRRAGASRGPKGLRRSERPSEVLKEALLATKT